MPSIDSAPISSSGVSSVVDPTQGPGRDDDELLAELRDALVPDRAPDEARVADFRSMVEQHHREHDSTPVTTIDFRRHRWALAAVASVVAVALGAAALLASDGDDVGEVEYAGAITTPDGRDVGTLDVVKTGIGRVIDLRTDDLEILPIGEYYEVWFVGPGDTPDEPNRISAGTFHPDPEGRSFVTFAAAVDPAKYPVVVVTAEPGDGDPHPTGAEVLRIDVSG